MVKKDANTCKNKELIPIDMAEEVVTNVLRSHKDDRQAKFFLYRICGLPPRISARLCNYNEDYGYKLDRKFREDQNLRSRIEEITGSIPEQYKALCKLRLVEIADIEGKAMVEYQENPKLAIYKPQLLKQVKQGAGVLGDDEQRPLPLIDIKAVQNLMIKTCQQEDGGDEGQE